MLEASSDRSDRCMIAQWSSKDMTDQPDNWLELRKRAASSSLEPNSPVQGVLQLRLGPHRQKIPSLHGSSLTQLVSRGFNTGGAQVSNGIELTPLTTYLSRKVRIRQEVRKAPRNRCRLRPPSISRSSIFPRNAPIQAGLSLCVYLLELLGRTSFTEVISCGKDVGLDLASIDPSSRPFDLLRANIPNSDKCRPSTNMQSNPSRRSHPKTRTGCKTCKTRKIKVCARHLSLGIRT
ncbi:hypothetical protein LZ32DRAFT_393734 [Colletotrichum eremochloae]|nr:hypothetical protein LZ32DRAFT_393734 [Colletotrichum eremochloae]